MVVVWWEGAGRVEGFVFSGGEMFGVCEGVFIYVRMVIPREKLRDDCGVALVEPGDSCFILRV
jgi:hypothetical protein